MGVSVYIFYKKTSSEVPLDLQCFQSGSLTSFSTGGTWLNGSGPK